jgi:hypothetical protein
MDSSVSKLNEQHGSANPGRCCTAGAYIGSINWSLSAEAVLLGLGISAQSSGVVSAAHAPGR